MIMDERVQSRDEGWYGMRSMGCLTGIKGQNVYSSFDTDG